MKTFLLIILLFYIGCAQEKWIQVEWTAVRLYDVQEFYRYGGDEGCLLIWEDQRTKIRYTQFVKQNDCDKYSVGMVVGLLIRK